MLDSPQLLPEKHSNRSILLLCHCCVFLMLLQMSKRGRLQSTRGALWVFNTVPGLKPRAVCLRGCVFEYPALWPQLSENAHSFTMPWFGEMTSLQGIPGDWSCCLQSSAEHGTVRFGSGIWLIFGTRAISQGCSLLFTSSCVQHWGQGLCCLCQWVCQSCWASYQPLG